MLPSYGTGERALHVMSTMSKNEELQARLFLVQKFSNVVTLRSS